MFVEPVQVATAAPEVATPLAVAPPAPAPAPGAAPAPAPGAAPSPAPAGGATVPGAAANELPLCVICHDYIVAGSAKPGLALFCGHVFHESCVLEWRDCAQKTERDCPFRCRYVDPILV